MENLTASKHAELVKLLTPYAGLALVKGRCQSVRKFGQRVMHVFILPAEDQYSMPSVVEIEAPQRRASAGEDCALLVRVGGFPNNFTGKDEDGRPMDVKSARNTLQAVFAD